jgi:hypothetical protein
LACSVICCHSVLLSACFLQQIFIILKSCLIFPLYLRSFAGLNAMLFYSINLLVR